MPTIGQLNKKIYQYQVGNFHCYIINISGFFKKDHIGFYGLKKDKEEYIQNRPV